MTSNRADLERPADHTHDDKLRVLRKLEALQDDHLRLLAAIVMEPAVIDTVMLTATRGGTLARRTGQPVEKVAELYVELQQEDLADRSASLGVMLTPEGAEQTSQMLTRLGHQLTDYLERGK